MMQINLCMSFVNFWSNFFLCFSSIALEPRVCTRWDMHRYAREAYEMGIRFIGGCCGFEPYHIRALSEEVKVFPLGNLINIHF